MKIGNFASLMLVAVLSAILIGCGKDDGAGVGSSTSSTSVSSESEMNKKVVDRIKEDAGWFELYTSCNPNMVENLNFIHDRRCLPIQKYYRARLSP